MQTHLLESVAKSHSRSVVVGASSPVSRGSTKNSPLQNLCLAARLSDAAFRLARAGVTAVQRLVEPLRTAVRAEMAKSGHALRPAICRSDAPEL